MRDHTKSLITLIREHIINPIQGCEVGVWWGGNASNLFRTFPNLHLLLVDNYVEVLEEDDPQAGMYNKLQEEIDNALVMMLRTTHKYRNRRSVLVSDSVEASTYLKDEFLDFVFIDAHHSEEAVRFDTQVWFPKLKVGGLFCGHDYGGKQDRRETFGVKKAVDEFARSTGYQVNVEEKSRVWWLIKE